MIRAPQVLTLSLAAFLAACADVPPGPPRIERISAEQLEARLPPPVAVLPLDDVISQAKQGVATEEIIARVRATGSRYRLSATQLVELARQGVPLALLDGLVADERQRLFDDLAADASKREQACRDRLENEARLCRQQLLMPLHVPGSYPMINCFPLSPGSPFWRCL